MRALLILSTLMLLGVLPARAQSASPVDPKMCATPTVGAANAASGRKAQQQVRAHIDSARNAYVKRDFAAAISELQAAYQLDPLVDVLFNIAQACREAGLDSEALALYEGVLKQSPAPEQLEASKAKIAELHAKLAEAESARAANALAEKRYAEAAAGFERAHQLNPKPIYLFRLGETMRLASKYSEAVAAYERVLQLAPTSSTAQDARRQLSALKAQQADEAATLQYGKGEYEQAILAWDTAYQQEARPIFLFRKAEALRQTNRAEAAAAAYERFLHESPESAQPELRQQAQTWVTELRKSATTVAKTAEKRPIYKRWWFWTAIGGGAALVGTGVAVGLLTATPKTLTAPDGVMVLQVSF